MSTLLYPPSLGRHFRRGRSSSLVGAVAAFGQLLSGNCSRATNSGRGWHGTWRTQCMHLSDDHRTTERRFCGSAERRPRRPLRPQRFLQLCECVVSAVLSGLPSGSGSGDLGDSLRIWPLWRAFHLKGQCSGQPEPVQQETSQLRWPSAGGVSQRRSARRARLRGLRISRSRRRPVLPPSPAPTSRRRRTGRARAVWWRLGRAGSGRPRRPGRRRRARAAARRG